MRRRPTKPMKQVLIDHLASTRLSSLAAGLVFAYAGILAGRLTPPRHTETSR